MARKILGRSAALSRAKDVIGGSKVGFVSILGYAQKLVAERVRPGDTVVDATVGRGTDTVFLAQLVGSRGAVYGFDIQQQALDIALEKLWGEQIASDQVKLLLRSHAEMEQALPQEIHGRIAAVMFNLGYLPGSDHTVITKTQTTLTALQCAAIVLRPGGIVTIVVYPGHEGGQEEADAVYDWAKTMPHREFQVLCYRFLNPESSAPFLIAVEKRKV
jgi:SAM-dependent methyltransferase